MHGMATTCSVFSRRTIIVAYNNMIDILQRYRTLYQGIRFESDLYHLYQ